MAVRENKRRENMATPVQIDFVGMCVLIRRPPKARVGLLNEFSHLHLLTFRQKDERHPRGVATLKILRPGRYTLKNCPPPGDVKLIDPDYLLPDLNHLSGAVSRKPEELDAALRSQLELPEGEFEMRPPANSFAKGPWRFTLKDGTTERANLTDRSSFTTTTDEGYVGLMRRYVDGDGKEQEVEVARLEPDENNRIHATIMAIDDDLQGRGPILSEGFALGEFQLLYAVVNSFGPIPVFDKQGANPDDATCPQGGVTEEP
jgi:hypothetical protein